MTVDAEFVLKHMKRKVEFCKGGQWNGRSIFGTSTDQASGRPTMLVERRQVSDANILEPPFTENIILDETTPDQFHDPQPQVH